MIYQVGSEDKSQAVDVLTAAFYNYPVMRYVLNQEWPDYAEKLRLMVDFFTEVRVVQGLPPFVMDLGEGPAAAALVNPPLSTPTAPELKKAFKQLIKAIGSANIDKLNTYEEKCEEMEPKIPHHYLGMIGVLPEHHRKGYGRLMLEHIHEIVDNDPTSNGIALNTENPNNVPIYRRFGYEVIGEAEVGPLHTWCMFRPSS